MASFFDVRADEYDERYTSPALRRHLTDRRMGRLIRQAREGQLFVDVGCGTGSNILLMPCAGAGLDVSQGMVKEARRKGLRAVVASGTRIPYESGIADFVSTQHVLHHVNFYLGDTGVRETIAEMVRIAKAGAQILVFEANPLNLYWQYQLRRHGEDNARLILPWRLARHLAAATGDKPRIEYHGFIPPWLPDRCLRSATAIEAVLETLPTRFVAAFYALTATVRPSV
jgi:ubiquinone/menaquinone biosynthesis C-methylase UbiE